MKKKQILLVLLLLNLLLIACAGSEIIRKGGAEAIDTAGCKYDCMKKDLGFESYDYYNHTCKCFAKDGTIVTLYSWGRGE